MVLKVELKIHVKTKGIENISDTQDSNSLFNCKSDVLIEFVEHAQCIKDTLRVLLQIAKILKILIFPRIETFYFGIKSEGTEDICSTH